MKAFHGDNEIKALNSVKLATKYFKKLGYKATEKSSVTSNGYDIVILKKDKSFTIEVKSAFYSSRSWLIGKTFDKENDFIAIVMPNNEIHIEDWNSHKAKCKRNGRRCITKIVNLYI
jgi:hypothetical protein